MKRYNTLKSNTSALPNPTPAFIDRIDQYTNFAILPSAGWLFGGVYFCIIISFKNRIIAKLKNEHLKIL